MPDFRAYCGSFFFLMNIIKVFGLWKVTVNPSLPTKDILLGTSPYIV